MDYADIEHNAESCRKLVDRCNQLASLKISNKSYRSKKLDIMTVVIGARESLRSLEVDTTFFSTAANTKLGRLTNLTSLTLVLRKQVFFFDINKIMRGSSEILWGARYMSNELIFQISASRVIGNITARSETDFEESPF